MRDSDVQKPPGIAEAIDWLAALNVLGIERLDEAAVERTLGSVLKYEEDQDVVRAAGLDELVRSGGWGGGRFGVETIYLDLAPLAGALGPKAARGRSAGQRRADRPGSPAR